MRLLRAIMRPATATGARGILRDPVCPMELAALIDAMHLGRWLGTPQVPGHPARRAV